MNSKKFFEVSTLWFRKTRKDLRVGKISSQMALCCGRSFRVFETGSIFNFARQQTLDYERNSVATSVYDLLGHCRIQF